MSLDTAGTSAYATVLLWSLNCFVEPNMRHLWLAALVGVCLAPLALARILGNTIDPVAIVSGNGLHVVLTGPIACTEGERVSLRVTVTQRETGAPAEGAALFACTGVIQQWRVLA